MCPEAAGPWMAVCVVGFGQAPRVVITSPCLGLYT